MPKINLNRGDKITVDSPDTGEMLFTISGLTSDDDGNFFYSLRNTRNYLKYSAAEDEWTYVIGGEKYQVDVLIGDQT